TDASSNSLGKPVTCSAGTLAMTNMTATRPTTASRGMNTIVHDDAVPVTAFDVTVERGAILTGIAEPGNVSNARDSRDHSYPPEPVSSSSAVAAALKPSGVGGGET